MIEDRRDDRDSVMPADNPDQIAYAMCISPTGQFRAHRFVHDFDDLTVGEVQILREIRALIDEIITGEERLAKVAYELVEESGVMKK